MCVQSPRGLLVICSLFWICIGLTLAAQQPLMPSDGDGQSNPFTFDPALDELIDDLLRLYHVPGISVAVIDQGTIASKGYGLAKFPDTPATADTMYYTGSTTKAFVAAAAGTLVEDPLSSLSWKSRVHELLPSDFVFQDDYSTKHTTLEDILSHRTGLPRHDLAYGWLNDSQAFLQTIRYLPLTAEPRTLWQYCNIMFAAAGILLEHLTKSTLSDFLRKTLWSPIGMKSTAFSLDEAVDLVHQGHGRSLARGYYWVEIAAPVVGFYVPESYLDLSPLTGAGAIVSTANDYALWVRSWLEVAGAETSSNTSSPLTKTLFSNVLEPRTIILDANDFMKNGFLVPPNYALGWITLSRNGYVIMTHGGGLPGFGTEVWIFPNDNLGIVTMGNTAGTSNLVGQAIIQAVLQRKLHMSQEESLDIISQLTSRGQSLHPLPSTIDLQMEQRNNRLAFATGDVESPLETHLRDFVGMYSHPGYGLLNISRVQPLEQLPNSGPHQGSKTGRPGIQGHLHAQLLNRMWLVDGLLSHRKKSFFDVEVRNLHGYARPDPVSGLDPACGTSLCKDEVVHETTGHILAYFEYDVYGNVERLGVELEAEMVRDAMERGGLANWREGMIWFDKL